MINQVPSQMLLKERQGQTKARYKFFTKDLLLKAFLSRKISPNALRYFLGFKSWTFRSPFGLMQTTFGRYFLQDPSCKIQRFLNLQGWPASFNPGWFSNWNRLGVAKNKLFRRSRHRVWQVVESVSKRSVLIWDLLKWKTAKIGCLFVLVATKLAKWQHTVVLSYLKFCF